MSSYIYSNLHNHLHNIFPINVIIPESAENFLPEHLYKTSLAIHFVHEMMLSGREFKWEEECLVYFDIKFVEIGW